MADLANFNEFTKLTKNYNNLPKIAPQAYQNFFEVFLQTFATTLIIFLFIHLIIYIFYIYEKKFATRYLLFYTVIAALSALVLIFSGYKWPGILSLIAYLAAFISVKKLNK